MVCPVIIPVQSFLPDHNGSPDGRVILVAGGCQCQMFVEVIHGRDDRCNVRCAAMRKEQSSIFENLIKNIRSDGTKVMLLTLKRSRNSLTISHLCSSIL